MESYFEQGGFPELVQMDTQKNQSIKDIDDGQHVQDLFLVKEMRRAETKNGKPYLMLTVMDATGEMAGRVWEQADRFMEECAPGSVISLNGQAQSYKDILQLKINSLAAVDSTHLDLSLFLPAAAGDINAMADELTAFAESITDTHLRGLLLEFFRDDDFMKDLKKAPAAKLMHHAYIGGLLEHTLAVTRLADMVAGLYPSLDRSLLLSGAMLHDIGKIQEFSFENYPFDYSDCGRLVGHMVLGVEMLQEKTVPLASFPDDLLVRLKHMILSHHGKHEFGSPAVPMVLESFVLHFIDDMDAKINYIDRLGNQAKDEGYQWTEYQRTLERFLFVRGHSEEEPEEKPAEEPEHHPAKSLFSFADKPPAEPGPTPDAEQEPIAPHPVEMENTAENPAAKKTKPQKKKPTDSRQATLF